MREKREKKKEKKSKPNKNHRPSLMKSSDRAPSEPSSSSISIAKILLLPSIVISFTTVEVQSNTIWFRSNSDMLVTMLPHLHRSHHRRFVIVVEGGKKHRKKIVQKAPTTLDCCAWGPYSCHKQVGWIELAKAGQC